MLQKKKYLPISYQNCSMTLVLNRGRPKALVFNLAMIF
jgi:hypothetical protein